MTDGSSTAGPGAAADGPRQAPRGRAKATDVAARAGVSIATVSLVANGKARGRVSPDTQARVQQAIEELGYVVNPAARSLVTGRRHCIALFAHDMTNPFISTVAAGVSAALDDSTQLLLALTDAGGGSPDIGTVVAFGVDGILLNYRAPGALRSVDPDLPIVFLDDPAARTDAPRVHFDLEPGATQLAGHLAALGHRRLLYLDPAHARATFTRRRSLLEEEFRRLVPGAEVLRARADLTIDAARDLTVASWAGWEAAGVTAVVTASDVQGHGVLAAFGELGVPVPDRVSVASFDNVRISALTDPSLTSVDLPAFDLGEQAAALLLDLIEHGPAATRTTALPTRLVQRTSTGPAAASSRHGRSASV